MMRMNDLQEAKTVSGIPVSVNNMLINWGRWCLGRGTQGKCFSLEGNFRPKGDGTDTKPSDPVDERMAIAVESVMRHFHPHSAKMHKLLKAHYVMQVPERATCRVLGIRFVEYDAELKKAALMVRNRVELIDIRNISY